MGTLLDRSLLRAVVADAVGRPATPTPLGARPLEVTAHSLVGARGRVWVVHNWSPEPRTVEVIRSVASLLDDARHDAGSAVALEPWDVRVWREG